MKFALLFALIIQVVASVSNARIEYAAKHRINRCTACHTSPVGGSLKNVNGKAYGQHGFAANPFANQDLVSADIRMIYFEPENSETNKGGLGIMNGQVGLNAPLMKKGKFPYETRLVYSHNVGGFGGTSPRNAYIRWKFVDDTKTSLLPQYTLVGRFHAPFGVVTDEHRTYVRLQNNTTWNDLEMGALFSANPVESVHYDLAIVNGEKTSGSSFGAGRANDWGNIVNLRYAPAWLPMFLGMSYANYSASTDSGNLNNSNPESMSAYTVVAMQRLFSWLPLSLIYEYQQSKNWNEDSAFIGYLGAGAYKTTVVNSESVGQLFRADYQLTEKFNLVYQYDSLLLNRDFTGDTFVRQGLGFRWVIGPNMLLNLRQETALGGSNTESSLDSRAKQKAFWVVLQVGI